MNEEKYEYVEEEELTEPQKPEEEPEEEKGRGHGKTRELSLINPDPIVNILVHGNQGTLIRDKTGKIEATDGKKYRVK